MMGLFLDYGKVIMIILLCGTAVSAIARGDYFFAGIIIGSVLILYKRLD